jgi:hypothetical protein
VAASPCFLSSVTNCLIQTRCYNSDSTCLDSREASLFFCGSSTSKEFFFCTCLFQRQNLSTIRCRQRDLPFRNSHRSPRPEDLEHLPFTNKIMARASITLDFFFPTTKIFFVLFKRNESVRTFCLYYVVLRRTYRKKGFDWILLRNSNGRAIWWCGQFNVDVCTAHEVVKMTVPVFSDRRVIFFIHFIFFANAGPPTK